MKKVIVLALVLFGLVLPAFAQSVDSIDISSMTIDELISLRMSINQELVSRFASDDTYIYSGTYQAGIDIVPGKYVFIVDELVGDSVNMLISIYEGEERISLNYLSLGEKFYVNIEEGITLKIFYGSGFFFPIDPSYAP